eukprot:3122791-Pyramimonas_sp.AAC.1
MDDEEARRKSTLVSKFEISGGLYPSNGSGSSGHHHTLVPLKKFGSKSLGWLPAGGDIDERGVAMLHVRTHSERPALL